MGSISTGMNYLGPLVGRSTNCGIDDALCDVLIAYSILGHQFSHYATQQYE